MPLGPMLLALGGVVLSVVAVFSYQWIALIPRLGVTTLYHLRSIRIAIATVAIGLAVSGYLLGPSLLQAGLIGVVLLLAPVSGFLNAKRVFVPVDDPPHVSGTEATLEADAMVLGTTIDGNAHAWAVDTLIPHHIVNDDLDGTAVLAAWCAYCHSGIVYDASVEGERLTFDPVTVRRRNMLMRDRETGTIWQHATGEALAGPLAGTELTVLPGQLLTWEAWHRKHPDTTLAVADTDEGTGLLSPHLTRRLADRSHRLRFPGLTAVDRRLPFAEEVIGVKLDGAAKAYPLATIRERSPIHDDLGESSLTIRFDPAANSVGITANGDPIGFQRTRWMGWFEFHPETAVFESSDG